MLGREPGHGHLGRYELIERVAVGGMAELYRARLRGAHGFVKQVAIKRILPQLADDRQFVDMFVDEANITARLQHPRIVPIFELGHADDELFMAMQYIEGCDLLRVMHVTSASGGHLDEALAVHIAREVLDALDHAHGATDEDGTPLQIVHRDVSPGNVLLSRRGDVWLTDFGIARAALREHRTTAGMLKGKYSYMSPEQVAGDHVDARSDLFAVGTVLAELVMGRHLFAAPSELGILLMVREGRLDRLHSHGGTISADLRAILERALQRHPDDRFPGAAQFRDALDDWLAARGARVGAAHIAALLADIAARPVADDELGVAPAPTISGNATGAARAQAARVAASARARFARSDPPDAAAAVPLEVDDELSGATEQPAWQADLREVSPLRLLHRLASNRATGLAIIEGRAGAIKEAYFTGGHPEFVASNLREERFGQYLVARGVLTEAELARAVAVLPSFGDRLADTLVGLDLLTPLQAFELLAAQVRDKLVSVCTWRKGTIRWFPGRANPWPARALHLDTYRILGAGVQSMELDLVIAWAEANSTRRPHLVVTRDPPAGGPQIPAGGQLTRLLDRFGLGGDASAIARIDGETSIDALSRAARTESTRIHFLRVLYLLVQCDCVTLT